MKRIAGYSHRSIVMLPLDISDSVHAFGDYQCI